MNKVGFIYFCVRIVLNAWLALSYSNFTIILWRGHVICISQMRKHRFKEEKKLG
jgi:hypothetical protein